MSAGSWIVSRLVPPEPEIDDAPEPTKVTVRLNFASHYGLRKIAERCGVSPTKAATALLEDAIQEGAHYLDHPEELVEFLPPGVDPNVLGNPPLPDDGDEADTPKMLNKWNFGAVPEVQF